eukprot:12789_1
MARSNTVYMKPHHIIFCLLNENQLQVPSMLTRLFRAAPEYDVFDDVSRKKICNMLFTQLFDDSTNHIYTFALEATLDMIGLEFLIDQHKFRNFLKLIYQFNTQLNQTVRFNFYVVICNIHNHKLLLKYIFSRKTMWKPFLLAIVSNITTCNDPDTGSWLPILHSMLCWKYKHYEFVIQHGIDEAIVHTIQMNWIANIDDWIWDLKSETQTKKSEFIDKITNTNLVNKFVVKALQRFYNIFKHYCKKKDAVYKYHEFTEIIYNKCRGLESSIKDSARQKDCVKLYCRKMSLLHECSFDYPEDCLKRCGWDICTIRRKDYRRDAAWYICKGCKLVYYCSRKHQKKHWNSAHASQCKQFMKK